MFPGTVKITSEDHDRMPAFPRVLVTCTLLAMALSPSLGAQESSDSTAPGQEDADSVRFELEGIAVEVSRPISTGAGASAIELELQNLATLPSPTLSEVLKRVPLLRIRTNSRGQAQPSLRGVEERQIAILVDGVPITLGWDNRTDLSVVPLTAARDITVVRGLSSVLSGPNVLGGVINVGITRGRFPDSVPPFRFQAAVDHNGTYALSGETAHMSFPDAGDFLIRAGGGYRDSPGSVLPSGLPEAVSQPVPEGDNLLNTDVRSVNGFVAARFRSLGGHWASLSSMAYNSRKGVLPELHVLEPRLWRLPSQWRSLTALSAGTAWGDSPFGGKGDIEANVGVDLGHTEIDEFSSFAYADSVGGQTDDDRTLSARMVADQTLGDGMLRGAVTFAETRHEQAEPGDFQVYKQRLWSLGAEAEHPLPFLATAGGFLSRPTLNLGASVDGSSNPLTGDKPPRDTDWAWGIRGAGSVLVARGRARLHGGFSRKVRFPALRELFSGALGRFEPNPDLREEVLKVAELAVTTSLFDRVETQLTLFRQDLEGVIVRVPVEDGRLQRQNRNALRSRGLELVAAWRGRSVGLEGELTLQDVEVLDPTAPGGVERAEYQPEVISGVKLDAPLFLGLRGRGEVRHTGRQFCVHPDTGSFDEVDSSVYLEAGVSRSLRDLPGIPDLRLSATASNLADEIIFQQCGLPEPGRTFRISIEIL